MESQKHAPQTLKLIMQGKEKRKIHNIVYNFNFLYEMVVRVDGGVHLFLNVLTWHKKLMSLFKFSRVLYIYIYSHTVLYLVLKTILQCR